MARSASSRRPRAVDYDTVLMAVGELVRREVDLDSLLQRALDTVTRGRTTVAIAHRLSTAQAADEVIVVDAGRIVQRGPHAELVQDRDSIYAKLYASWLEQTR